jgi:hypothetical protein
MPKEAPFIGLTRPFVTSYNVMPNRTKTFFILP